MIVVVTVVLAYLQSITIHDEGSPKLAAEWQALLAPLDPNSTEVGQPPAVDLITFQNGDWLLGLSQDSHGFWPPGGGTVVVKDSKNRIRAFFGHVCGPHFLGANHGSAKMRSVDEFFRRLTERGFVEYEFPYNP